MKNYVINIFSVVILAIILSLLLPKGKMTKSIKSIFIFVISLVIIMPFTRINYEKLLENLSSYSYEINYQTDYLNFFNDKKNQNNEKNIDKILYENGILNASSKIKYTVNKKNEYFPVGVDIDLKNAKYIKENFEDSKILILDKIQALLNIERDYIKFNE